LGFLEHNFLQAKHPTYRPISKIKALHNTAKSKNTTKGHLSSSWNMLGQLNLSKVALANGFN